MSEKRQNPRQFWLLKTEPHCWSWQNQEDNKGLSVWDGVRNGQAQKLMKGMSVDDLCLFYHTGKLKEVAGVVRVVKTFYPDPTDDTGKWGAVDVQEVVALKQPVTLAQLKNDEHFKDFLMLRQPRLSVVPVEESIWERVCELGGVEKAESLGVNKAGKKGGRELKKGEAEKTENGMLPAKGANTSNRNSKRSTTKTQSVETTEIGSAEGKQVKSGARKRGAKEVIDEPKKNTKSETKPPTGSRAPKTRKKTS